MKRKTFDKLTAEAQKDVLAQLPDAKAGDRRWYYVHNTEVVAYADMDVGRQVPQHRSGGGL